MATQVCVGESECMYAIQVSGRCGVRERMKRRGESGHSGQPDAPAMKRLTQSLRLEPVSSTEERRNRSRT